MSAKFPRVGEGSRTFFSSKSIRFVSFMFFCLVFAVPLCASVYMCLEVTCWEGADLLALVCGV